MGALIALSVIVPAAAASLGGIQASALGTAQVADQRCAPELTAQAGRQPSTHNPNRYDAITFSSVPAACAGLPVQLTVAGPGGVAHTATTAVASSPTFTVGFSPWIKVSDYRGVAVTVDGWGIPTVGGGGGGGGPVTTTTTIKDDWGTGYCADVTESTTSTTPVTWTAAVSLAAAPLEGTPYQVWNANWSFDAGTSTLHATGVSWNATVVAGSPATWGYCANRPTPPPPPPPPPSSVTATVSITTDWGAGYCAAVVVATTSATPVTWTVDVSLATAPTNGTPSNVWEASWSFSPGTQVLHAAGLAYNATVVAGSPVSFGYCANR